MSDLVESVEGVTSILVSVVILAVALSFIVQAFAGAGSGSAELLVQESSVNVEPDGSVALDVNNVTQVKNTTGRAAAVGQSSVEINGDLGVPAGNRWHFSTYVSLDQPDTDQLIWAIEDDLRLSYVDPEVGGDEWRVWFYDESSQNSYQVRVDATVSSGTLVNVQVFRVGSDLVVANKTGAANSVTVTGSSSAQAQDIPGFAGRVEETRTWDTNLTASQSQTLRDQPLQPVAVGNRSARLMFDKQGRDVAVDLSSASGEIVGSSSIFGSVRVSGLSGGTLVEGVDYEVTTNSNGEQVVEILAGGQVEEFPRLAVTTSVNTPGGVLGALLGTIRSAISLLVLVALAIGGAAAFSKMNDQF